MGFLSHWDLLSPSLSTRLILLYNYEPACLMEVGCLQLVEIDTARNMFSGVVAAIPISGTPPTVIKACGLKADRKSANQLTRCVINGY